MCRYRGGLEAPLQNATRGQSLHGDLRCPGSIDCVIAWPVGPVKMGHVVLPGQKSCRPPCKMALLNSQNHPWQPHAAGGLA